MCAQSHLFERIRHELRRSLAGYVEVPEVDAELDEYVVPPGLGTMAGPLGALALAADAETDASERKHVFAAVAR
jgi:fructokinase